MATHSFSVRVDGCRLGVDDHYAVERSSVRDGFRGAVARTGTAARAYFEVTAITFPRRRDSDALQLPRRNGGVGRRRFGRLRWCLEVRGFHAATGRTGHGQHVKGREDRRHVARQSPRVSVGPHGLHADERRQRHELVQRRRASRRGRRLSSARAGPSRPASTARGSAQPRATTAAASSLPVVGRCTRSPVTAGPAT